MLSLLEHRTCEGGEEQRGYREFQWLDHEAFVRVDVEDTGESRDVDVGPVLVGKGDFVVGAVVDRLSINRVGVVLGTLAAVVRSRKREKEWERDRTKRECVRESVRVCVREREREGGRESERKRIED